MKSVAAEFFVKVIESLTQVRGRESDGRQNGENSIALEQSKINSVGQRFLLFHWYLCVSKRTKLPGRGVHSEVRETGKRLVRELAVTDSLTVCSVQSKGLVREVAVTDSLTVCSVQGKGLVREVAVTDSLTVCRIS